MHAVHRRTPCIRVRRSSLGKDGDDHFHERKDGEDGKDDNDNDFCEILSQFLFSQNQAMTFR